MYEAECFFEALSEKLDVVLENNEVVISFLLEIFVS